MKLSVVNLSKENDKLSTDKLNLLRSIFVERLSKLNINCNVTVADNSIFFCEVEPGKIFRSKRINKIILSETDKRRTPEKPFLKSMSLTENQYKGMIDCILGGLKRLEIKATVLLERKDKTELWHENLIDMAIEKPTKFPVEF